MMMARGGGSPPPRGAAIAKVMVDRAVFAHGVASGDPLRDRVLLWTRVTQDTGDPVSLSWVVTSDPELTDVVQEGTVSAEPERDYTVVVDVEGLAPGTTYYYAFAASEDARSLTGRTRTLPEAGIDRARIAFTSCANYNNGYFNAYRAIAQRADLDLWIHLGDYIYESADGVYGDPEIDRAYEPAAETLSLEDYRARHAQYRRDPDLQELHRQHPIIVVWDDHETANDAYVDGAENHQPDEGDWSARKRAGMQAFLEWLPVRAERTEPTPQIYRAFAFGDLFDLLMLDTRYWARDMQAGYGEDKGEAEVWTDPNRTLIGDDQETWLLDSLKASRDRGTVWRFIGNQVIFSPTRDPRDGLIVFADFWDGYQAQRTRIVDQILANGIDNLVFLTGDIHTSWAIDVARDPFDPEAYDPATGEGAFAVEVVGPAVSSPGLEGTDLAALAPTLLRSVNPHVHFSEVTRKGYVLLDVTPERVQAEWYFVRDHKQPGDSTEELGQVFVCQAGAPHLVAASEVSMPRADASPLAPSEAATAAVIVRAAVLRTG
jgi:alkaline phosphatase D